MASTTHYALHLTQMVLLAGAGISPVISDSSPSCAALPLACEASLRFLSVAFSFGELSFPNTEWLEFINDSFSSGFGVF